MNNEECSFHWFYEAQELGCYKSDLDLNGWANEIEWRIKYKKMIKPEKIGRLNSEWLMFLDSLKSGENRTQSDTRIASKAREPVRRVKIKKDDWGSNRPYFHREYIDINEGWVSQFIVNLSYDDKTLYESFKKTIKALKDDLEPSRNRNNKLFKIIIEPEKGLKKLTNHDALKWNDHKILECIDYILWKDMTGCSLIGGDKAYSKILKISKDVLKQNSIHKARWMLNRQFVGRIRASLYLARNRGV